MSLVGVDCPLGWPSAFTDLVLAHRRGSTPADAGADVIARRRLALRRTDFVVRQRTGRWPLSVSADLIAYPAMRCAGLQARIGRAGPVRRSGIGSVLAEVYPAAALSRWSIPAARPKKDPVLLAAVVERLARRAPRLRWGAHMGLCRVSHDAFDAVIAALVAAAVVLGRTELPGPDDLAAADEEGWIHLPDPGFLDLLAEVPGLDTATTGPGAGPDSAQISGR